jgi:hypothetical protein
MTAVYSILLIGVPLIVAATAVGIGIAGVRYYLQELRGSIEKEG